MRIYLAFFVAAVAALGGCKPSQSSSNADDTGKPAATAKQGDKSGVEQAAPKEAVPAAIPAPPDVAAPPADALKTTSGMSIKVLQPGKGSRHPRPSDQVTVHYTGWTTDGKMFDSSVARGKPATLSLEDVIRGWTEGMQLMVEGERTRFWIPQDLAYKGEANSPRGMLVFDVDLIRIE